MFFGYDVSSAMKLFFGMDFCGSLSTFSTFSYETFVLLRQREHILALINISANIVVTISLVFFRIHTCKEVILWLR